MLRLIFLSLGLSLPFLVSAQAWNDTMLFKVVPAGLEAFGSTDEDNLSLKLLNGQGNGGRYIFMTTGGTNPVGAGKLLIANAKENQVVFAIDSMGRIGNRSNPHPSSLFEIRGTSGGLLLPRLTTSQIEGIEDPVSGLLVYDKNKERFAGVFNDTMLVMAAWRDKPNAVVLDGSLAKNVGIGTSFPQAELHVIGDIQASGLAGVKGILRSDENGKIFNDTMLLRRQVMQFNALDFRAGQGLQLSFDIDLPGASLNEGAGSMTAQLDLQHGSVWNDTMMVVFKDNSAASMTMEIIAVELDGGSSITLWDYEHFGSAPGIQQKFFLPEIEDEVLIDLTTYAYFFKVTSANWNGNGLQVYGGYIRQSLVYD